MLADTKMKDWRQKMGKMIDGTYVVDEGLTKTDAKGNWKRAE